MLGAICEAGATENGEDAQPARPPASAKIAINLNIWCPCGGISQAP